jgi:hypothetical protein
MVVFPMRRIMLVVMIILFVVLFIAFLVPLVRI